MVEVGQVRVGRERVSCVRTGCRGFVSRWGVGSVPFEGGESILDIPGTGNVVQDDAEGSNRS